MVPRLTGWHARSERARESRRLRHKSGCSFQPEASRMKGFTGGEDQSYFVDPIIQVRILPVASRSQHAAWPKMTVA